MPVKIEPHASNAFSIEVSNRLDPKAPGFKKYILEVHTDGLKVHIIARDSEGNYITLEAIEGNFDGTPDTRNKMKFMSLHLQPKEPKK